MDTRLIWESRTNFVLRIPGLRRSCRRFSILEKRHKDGRPYWSFTRDNTLSSSLLYFDKWGKRHFVVIEGKIKFCDDDAVAPKATSRLVPIRKIQVEDWVKLLPDSEQTSPLV